MVAARRDYPAKHPHPLLLLVFPTVPLSRWRNEKANDIRVGEW